MVQENERGMGNWHAEWETLPEICTLTAGALQHMTQVLEGLELDVTQMARNLDATRGQILAESIAMALSADMGRPRAKSLVEQACRQASQQERRLRDVLMENPQVRERLSSSDLDGLFNPSNYLGLADTLVDRALGAQSKKSHSDSE
jgi:3-carboxy-cis,cis-muconate cycloisomerase